jgi:hypothetical protein
MYFIRDKNKYRAKVQTKNQADKTGFTDGLRCNKRWNIEIEVKNSGLDYRQPTIIYNDRYVSLDDVLIITEK